MAESPYQLTWTKRSLKQIKAAFDYIYEDSPQNAVKVVDDLAKMVDKAAQNPEIYAPDKYKISNDGTYRAFEKHHYRVSYRYSNNIIRVLRVRDTTMKPLMYCGCKLPLISPFLESPCSLVLCLCLWQPSFKPSLQATT